MSDDVGSIVHRLRRLGVELSQIEGKAAVQKLPKSMGETLSAFANGGGDLVILGLDEKNGFIPTQQVR